MASPASRVAAEPIRSGKARPADWGQLMQVMHLPTRPGSYPSFRPLSVRWRRLGGPVGEFRLVSPVEETAAADEGLGFIGLSNK